MVQVRSPLPAQFGRRTALISATGSPLRPRRPAGRAPTRPKRSPLSPAPMQGNFKFHQFQVVGRHLPTEAEPTPTVYRMKVWAEDAVRAKSKFW